MTCKSNIAMRGMLRFMLAILLCLTWGPAQSAETLRIGVLKFGTVNWTLEVIRSLELDSRHGFALEVVPLAGKNATHVAMLGGAVDMIVTDWIWVSRQRQAGGDYTFVPYSTASGAIMVRPDSGIEQVADLAGQRLGVAGGPVDKSWLLFSAYTNSRLGMPADRLVEPNFAAPPLLNELTLRGEIPASLNFWHYSARLAAAGMRTLLPVRDMLPALGIERDIPLIGWVFGGQWARDNPGLLAGFLAAAGEAQQRMDIDNSLWGEIRPMLKAEDDRMADGLRDAFRDGIVRCFDKASVDAVERAFEVLAEIGGEALVGDSAVLSEGTIWPGIIDGSCG